MAMNEENVTPKNQDEEPVKDILGPEEELDFAEMTKGHRGLKIAIGIMTAIIVVLFYMIAMKAMELLVADGEAAEDQKAASTAPVTVKQAVDKSTPVSSTLSKPKGGKFLAASASGDQLVLTYEMPNGDHVVQLVDTATGKISASYTLTK